MNILNGLYRFIVDNQVEIREDINGAGMVLCASLTLMIFIFMCNSWINAGRKRMSVWSWAHMPGVPMACALLWLFGAETYRCGAIWHIYHSSISSRATGTFADVTFWPTLGYMVAGGVLVGALLRCTYLFAPPLLRSFVWLTTAMIAVGFLVLSHLSENLILAVL